jgi:hypothetical protein
MGISYRVSIGHVSVFGWDPEVTDGWPVTVVQNSTYDFSQHASIPLGVTPTYTKISGDPAILIDSATGMGTIGAAAVTTADLVIRLWDGRSEVAQVTGLTVTGTAFDRVSLRWTNVSGESGYLIDRSLASAENWSQVGLVAANVTTFVDSSVSVNTSYDYRVRAYDSNGNQGLNSTTVTATTPIVTNPGTADWAERSTAPGVIWAHDFSNPDELLVSYIAPANADHGNDVVFGVHPNIVCPHTGVEPDGTTYFEEALIGAKTAAVVAEATLTPHVYSTGVLTRINDTYCTLTLPLTDDAGNLTSALGMVPTQSTFKITSTSGLQTWFLNADEVAGSVVAGPTSYTVTCFAGVKQAALSTFTGFTLKHCVLDSEANPVQTIVIDEDILTQEFNTSKWENPDNPLWDPLVGTIPADAYSVVIHYSMPAGAIIKDKLTVYAASYDASTKLTTLVVRRASMAANGEGGRRENDWINRSFPCEFPIGSVVGRDNKGGWARSLAAMKAGGNGLTTDDLAGGELGDTDPPVRRRDFINPSTGKRYTNFRAGYYGHKDYHGIWNDTNPYHPSGYPSGTNTLIDNGYSPYDGDEFYLSFDLKYSETWLYTTTKSKTFFIDCFQREAFSQIVGNAPTQDERRWKWYHNKGADANSQLSGPTADGSTASSYQNASEEFAATCVSGNLTDLGACWQPPIDEYFTVQIYLKAGHDNEIDYTYKDVDDVTGLGASLVTVVEKQDDPNYPKLYPDMLTGQYMIVDCVHQPVLKGMTRNLDGTADPVPGLVGKYFRSNDNPTGADPTTGNYFQDWKITIAVSPSSTATNYGGSQFSPLIKSHTVVNGLSRYILVKRRPSDTWPALPPIVGSKVKIDWNSRSGSARYRDTTIKLWKKERTDTDWVPIIDLQNFPIAFNKGGSPAGDRNPPGWSEFQPTGYANVDDNNTPPDKTRWVRTTKVILSKNFIAAPK